MGLRWILGIMVPSLRLFPERRRRRSGPTGLQRLERPCPRLRLGLNKTLFSLEWRLSSKEHTGRKILFRKFACSRWIRGQNHTLETKNQSIIYMKIWIQNHTKRQATDIGYVELLGTWKMHVQTFHHLQPSSTAGSWLSIFASCALKSPNSNLKYE